MSESSSASTTAAETDGASSKPPAASSAESPWASASLALGLATCGSVLVAVPGALRVSGQGSVVVAWLALVGSAALMAAPAAAGLRLALPLPRAAWSAPLGLAFSLAPLIVLARLLILRTHHRPLGATTFAIVAAMMLLGAIAVAARLLVWSSGRSGLLRALPLLLGGLSLALGALLALPVTAGPLRGSLLDGGLLLAVTLAAALVRVPGGAVRALSRVGAFVWLAAVLIALSVGLASAELRALLDERAPVLLGLAGWLRA